MFRAKIPLLLLLVNLASCADSNDEMEFNLTAAEKRWTTADKIWNAGELKALEQGRTVYKKNCGACHGRDGKGDLTIGAPALLNNAILTGDISYHIALIKRGKNQMPAFAQVLTDDEIANVAAYERNAWGNHDYQVFNGVIK